MPPDPAAAAAENTDSWNHNFSEEHKETFKGFDSQEKLFEAIGYKVPEVKKAEPEDWRAGLNEEEKKTAERFTDPASMVRSVQDSRKRESLIRVPGKGATDEETATYHKAIGVPEKPEGYIFKLPEGETATPETEASNKQWGERLHALNMPAETVNTLLGFMQEDAAAFQEAETQADADFVAQSEAELKSVWKGAEFEKNKDIANKAFKAAADRAGINMDDLTNMQTSDGRFLMDHPSMLKIFSIFGREMAEGTLGPTMTNDERDTGKDQLAELRSKQEAATAKGNSKEANRFYQLEQELIARMDGNKPIK